MGTNAQRRQLTVSGMPPSSKYISGRCPSVGFCFILGTALVTLHASPAHHATCIIACRAYCTELAQHEATATARLHDQLVRVLHDALQSFWLRYITDIHIFVPELLLLLWAPAATSAKHGLVISDIHGILLCVIVLIRFVGLV